MIEVDSKTFRSGNSEALRQGGVPLAPEGAAIRRQTLDELYATLEILDFGQQDARTYRDIIQALGFSRAKIIVRMIAAQGRASSRIRRGRGNAQLRSPVFAWSGGGPWQQP